MVMVTMVFSKSILIIGSQSIVIVQLPISKAKMMMTIDKANELPVDETDRPETQARFYRAEWPPKHLNQNSHTVPQQRAKRRKIWMFARFLFQLFHVPLKTSLSIVRFGGNESEEGEVGAARWIATGCSSAVGPLLLHDGAGTPTLAKRVATMGPLSSKPKTAACPSEDIAVNHCRSSSWKFFAEGIGSMTSMMESTVVRNDDSSAIIRSLSVSQSCNGRSKLVICAAYNLLLLYCYRLITANLICYAQYNSLRATVHCAISVEWWMEAPKWIVLFCCPPLILLLFLACV